METQLFTSPALEQVPTWQLPRRFDVVVWFARLQKMKLLDRVRLDLPAVGPAVALLDPQYKDELHHVFQTQNPYPYHKPEYLGSTAQVWFPHEDYMESFTAWEARNKHLNTHTAALTWMLSLRQESWEALLCLLLDNKSASPEVASAIVTLFLALGDIKLIGHVKEEHLHQMHHQIYADDLGRGLYWLETWDSSLLNAWIRTIKNTNWGQKIWYRLPIGTQEYFTKYES